MPVDFNGLFHRPNVDVDFTGIERGGAAMGNAYANIGQSIGHGLIQRAKLKEEKRQYDLQLAYRKTLQHAQDLRQQELDVHRAAVEARTAAHQGVLEQQGAARLGMEQQRIGQQIANQDRTQGRLEMDARRRSDEAALQRIHQEAEAHSAKQLAGEMLDRGDLTDQEHALATMQLDSGDPVQVRQVAQGMVAKSREMDQKAIDEDLKKAGPKELIATLTDKRKALDEAGIKVDPESFLEARAAAVAFSRSYSRGPALAAEFKQLQSKMSGVGSGKAKKDDAPKVTLPSGREVSDPVGFSKGGAFEDQTRRQRDYLVGIAQEEAQHDPTWPTPQTAIASKMLEKGEALTSEEMAAAIAEVPTLQQNLTIQYANQIASINGWRTGEQPKDQAAAPQQSAAPVTIDSLKAKAIAEGWTKEQFFEEARKAGIK